MSDIKSNGKILSAPLCFLINLSIPTGIVPNKMKIAGVVPVYKSENPSTFCNRRPISILLEKLENYGIRGLALKWMCSYLTDRKQYVKCKTVASEYQTVKCVPQGSIVGPLLSLLYINDIHFSSSLPKFILFADDTNVLFSNDDFNMLQDILNSEF